MGKTKSVGDSFLREMLNVFLICTHFEKKYGLPLKNDFFVWLLDLPYIFKMMCMKLERTSY